MVATFKVITLASSIEEKTINLFKDRFYDGGSISVANSKIRCWKTEGHGSESFLEVVENSCNPGFVVMGQKLGKEKLMNYVHKFGFGEKTGIDLSGEENGILFKTENMGPLELATTSFGQGVSVTPIQQVMGVSAAINGGNLYTPYIVKSIYDKDTLSTIKLNDKVLKRKVISEETSKLVRYTLESVVARGTGRNAYIEGYRVGGKTGTAQKVSNGSYMDNNYILSFISFLPANKPEFVVYVALDNPSGVTKYGGTASAPIAKAIMKDIIEYYKLKKDKTGIERVYELWDTKYVEIPNVIGVKKSEVGKLLKEFSVEYTGSGDVVINMSPSPGEFIPQNEKVRIMLGS